MSKRMGAEAGQDLVEYALVLPLFLLLIFSIIEFGILFFQYSTVSNAAREGARAAAVVATEGCDDACVSNRVRTAAQRLTTGLDPKELTIQVSFPKENGASYVRVEVQYRDWLSHKNVGRSYWRPKRSDAFLHGNHDA